MMHGQKNIKLSLHQCAS